MDKETIKQLLADGVISQEVAEKYFPELAESEDERIRKDMIETIKKEAHDFPSSVIAEKSNTWLSWLEKQGKKETDEWVKAIPNEIEHFLNELEKKGEQKPTKTVIEAWKDMRLEVYQQASGNRHEPNYSDDTSKMFSLNDIDEIFEKIADINVEQQQKLWSEEDEKMFNSALWHVKTSCGNGGKNSGEFEVYNWLKSLKDRVQPQPKQEWSEEDGRCIRYLIECLEVCVKGTAIKMLPSTAQKYIEWLKSLRPQNTWKPSDGQMKVLNEVLNFAANHENPHWNNYIFGTLHNLIRQLKKLREE